MIQRFVCSCQKTFGSRKSGRPISKDRITRVVCPRSPTVIAVSQSLIFHPLPGAALFAMSRVDGDQGRAACSETARVCKIDDRKT
jgi:hypothetical protein